MQHVFERSFQGFTIEHAGKVNEGARRTGHRHPVSDAPVPLCYLAPMHDDSWRLQPTLARDPDMDASLNDCINSPEVRSSRVRSNRAITSPEDSCKRGLSHGPRNEG
jgi:hypothetical protein